MVPTIAELALIFLIMLVVFGANRLPAAGDALGRWARRLLERGREPRRRTGRGEP